MYKRQVSSCPVTGAGTSISRSGKTTPESTISRAETSRVFESLGDCAWPIEAIHKTVTKATPSCFHSRPQGKREERSLGNSGGSGMRLSLVFIRLTKSKTARVAAKCPKDHEKGRSQNFDSHRRFSPKHVLQQHELREAIFQNPISREPEPSSLRQGPPSHTDPPIRFHR